MALLYDWEFYLALFSPQLLQQFNQYSLMKLYESLYIFLRYSQDIRFLFELMIDFGYRERKQDEWNLKEKTHYITLYNTILMNVCSYLDEYNKHFLSRAEEEYKQQILSIKKIAKPAFKKVNDWKDLKEYRNNMIAHNFRINGDVFSFNSLGHYNAPRTYRDIALLRKYLMMIQGVIEAEFRDEMSRINPFIKTFSVKEQQINYETIEDDLKGIVQEINLLCQENDKPYMLDVDLFMKL